MLNKRGDKQVANPNTPSPNRSEQTERSIE